MNPALRRLEWARYWQTFEVYSPAGQTQDLKAMNQLLVQLWARTLKRGLYQWWHGQPWLCYEKRATPGQVQTIWAVNRSYSAFLREELRAYSSAEVNEVDLVPLPEGRSYAGVSLGLVRPICFGLGRQQIDGEIRGALEGLRDAESAIVQLLLVPLADREWQRVAHGDYRKHAQLKPDGSTEWREGGDSGAEGALISAWDSLMHAANLPGLASGGGTGGRRVIRQDRMDPVERKRLAQAPDKLKEHGFEAFVRVAATAPTKARAVSIVRGAVAQFASLDDANQVMAVPIWRQWPAYTARRFWRMVGNRWPNGHSNIWTCGELACVVGAPGGKGQEGKVQAIEMRTAPPTDGVLIGTALYRGERAEFRIPTKALKEHLLVAGRTGKGKGVTQIGAALDMARQGLGFTWLFPLRRDAYALMAALPKERLEDVIFAEVGHPRYAMPLNILANDGTPEDIARVSRDALNLFARLFADGWGNRSEMLFRLSLRAAASVGGTVADAQRVLEDPAYAQRCAPRVHNPSMRNKLAAVEEWGTEVDAPLNKFSQLTEDDAIAAMLCQPGTIDWLDVVKGRRIVIVSLNEEQMGELTAKVAAGAIVNQLLRTVKSIPPDQREQVFHVLGIDEFRIVDGEKTKSFWQEGFSQARQFNLGMLVAIQYPNQLTTGTWGAIEGNVGSAIILGQRGDGAHKCLQMLGKAVSEADITFQPALQSFANIQVEDITDGRDVLSSTGAFTLYAPPYAQPLRDAHQAAEASMAKWLTPVKPQAQGADQAPERVPARKGRLEVD